jgi:lipoprotein-releasing system ATP-binding protein
MPQMIAGTPREKAAERARELLKMVDLSARAEHRPARLSGGEQQRVAIVRALANNPDLLLADEPTGNLDPTTSDLVFHHLRDVVRETETGALVATHNRDLAKRMDRVIELRDGLLVEASLVA